MIYQTPIILQDFSNPYSYKLFYIPTKTLSKVFEQHG